ncbi:hypothetical protein SSX86_006744 [Deinandra increscens subsp. villosa]|uniref:Membrane protein of ER body-like protein n=1 Tax=Deinandra increscens subsp. villosa TaxID=3103831 RepID=A0AAP0DK44_9ASTR
MENTEVVEHPWNQETEDEELEEGLVARRKNYNFSTTINGDSNAASVGVTSSRDHNHQQDEEEEQQQVVKDFIQQNDIKVDEEDHISEFCVYYDQDKGIWKCQICSWDNQGRTCLAHHNQHPRWHSAKTIYETKGITKSHVSENTDITNNNQENGNGTHSVIRKPNGEHKKDEMPFEGVESVTSYIDNKTEIGDIEVVKADDEEITEYDVEKLIRKQDTHDLFCPNCNSCITKRVILRKRKRRVPVSGEDPKRSKPQTPASSELNVVLEDISDNQALNGVNSRLDDHQREPDVFRCLSCFSIFMPTGNGFKLFRMLGNKSNEDDEHSQKEVPVKKSWFSNFLRSEKVEHNGANSYASNSTTDLQKAQLQSDKVIRESNGMMETDSTLAGTQEQLLTSYNIEKESNNKSEYPGMFVVKPPLTNDMDPSHPTGNSISPLQHDGLKLFVPPNVGSLIIDNSQMTQELDITVQTNSPGLDETGRSNLSISPPASKLGQLKLGNQMDIDSVQSTDVTQEVSQHTIQKNAGIHLEEPLEVNKDILTDKKINLLANVNNIERIKGNETIITIESKQVDASAFQTPPESLGATGTPALQQAAEQGGVSMATGSGRSLDIIKSIVYGGLIELITSLSVVSSAAGADAATLNVLAMGLANIFGGLFVISHDLWNLKSERTRKTEDRYQQLLGQRADFPLHMAVSLLSYLIFGILPPMVYGFSFQESNDKDLKLLMVAAASVGCIMILAAGKTYVKSHPRKSYFKTIGYHVVLGFMVSGVSYLSGGLIMKLLAKIGVFHEGSVENLVVHGASSNPTIAAF